MCARGGRGGGTGVGGSVEAECRWELSRARTAEILPKRTRHSHALEEVKDKASVWAQGRGRTSQGPLRVLIRERRGASAGFQAKGWRSPGSCGKISAEPGGEGELRVALNGGRGSCVDQGIAWCPGIIGVSEGGARA